MASLSTMGRPASRTRASAAVLRQCEHAPSTNMQGGWARAALGRSNTWGDSQSSCTLSASKPLWHKPWEAKPLNVGKQWVQYKPNQLTLSRR